MTDTADIGELVNEKTPGITRAPSSSENAIRRQPRALTALEESELQHRIDALSKANTALEAENAKLRAALGSVELQADNAAWNIGRPGRNFTPADIQAGYFNIRDFARRALGEKHDG